jgi:hypothetical protein
LAAARALVDDWVCTPFESNSAAIDDLIRRIAAALLGCDAPAAIAGAPAIRDDRSEPQ